jgi:hypothetical protein
MYSGQVTAIYSLDPTGGGINIPEGQVISVFNIVDTTYNSLKFTVNQPGPGGITTSTSGISTFSADDIGSVMTFSISKPGTATLTSYTITLSNDTELGYPTVATFISDVLANGIPNLQVFVNTTFDGTTITFNHTAGGLIQLTNVTGTPVQSAGFVSGQGTGFIVVGTSASISNFKAFTSSIHMQASAPYAAPAAGTYWNYSNLADVDVMINDNGWKGYRNVTSDIRGYDLSLTNAGGVIVSPSTQPTSQVSGAELKAGDLWLDSAALAEEEYPHLFRYTGVEWVAIVLYLLMHVGTLAAHQMLSPMR